VVAYHHERWDGGGYPWGLAGIEIPLAARIFAVVDAFDAITSDRPYRRAQSVNEAIREIEDGVGSQFDPAIVRAFMPLAHELNRADHPLHLLRD
jgi:HD-GYP domain-containing protein (c-di-GMP phosphodiesterase class II)